PTTDIYPLSLHDALPISVRCGSVHSAPAGWKARRGCRLPTGSARRLLRLGIFSGPYCLLLHFELLLPFPAPLEKAPERSKRAFREKDHGSDEHEAEHHLPAVSELADEIFQQDDGRRPDECAEQCANSADDGHQQPLDGLGKLDG